MNSSVLFGLGTIVAWEFWIVFGELVSDTIDPVTVAAISYVAVAVVPSATPSSPTRRSP